MAKKQKKAYLLGLGLDSDGHFRYTKGENFHLVGGTQATHEILQEKAVKLNEQLKKKGKALEEVSTKEFEEIAHKVGLREVPFNPPIKESKERKRSS